MNDPGFHPACLLFPPLPQAEFAALVADIATRGLVHPIVLHEGLVLDGRNRLLACRRAGVEPRFTPWRGTGSPVTWAISTNMVRRHLTSSQRAVLALDLLPLLSAEAKARQKLSRGRGRRATAVVDAAAPPRGKATQFAARVAATNSAYVERAKKLRAECRPLLDAVRLGHLSLAEAGRLARLPDGIRRQAMQLRHDDPGRRMGDVLRECFADHPPPKLTARPPTGPARGRIRIWCGDCLSLMRSLIDDASVDVVCTSPPYNVGAAYRTYDDRRPPAEFTRWLDDVFRELRRVLKPAGSLFLVAGHSPRHPWAALEIARAAAAHFVLQNQIAWVKSVAIDGRTRGHYRPVAGRRHLNRTWEHVFHFSPDGRAPIDRAAVGVANADASNLVRHGDGSGVHCGGDAWFIPHETIRSSSARGDHPATFPVELAERCLRLAGCRRSSLVLDPFCGVNGIAAAAQLGARGIGIDVDPAYCGHAAAACGAAVEHRPRRPR